MKNEPCGHDIDDWIEPKNESDPFCLGCVRKLIREEAKKEVLDAIEKLCNECSLSKLFMKDFYDVKKRHLSTFPKKKRHNSRKIN